MAVTDRYGGFWCQVHGRNMLARAENKVHCCQWWSGYPLRTARFAVPERPFN